MKTKKLEVFQIWISVLLIFSLLPENSYGAFAFLKIKLKGINAKTNTKGDKESP